MLKNVIIKLSKEKSDNIIKAIMNNIQTFSGILTGIIL
jgi:hypothetical protein